MHSDAKNHLRAIVVTNLNYWVRLNNVLMICWAKTIAKSNYHAKVLIFPSQYNLF